MSGLRLNAADSLPRIPGPNGERSTLLFEHGTLTVKLYAPGGVDPQQPHARDEAYVVISGRGTFVHGDRRDPFQANDFLWPRPGCRIGSRTSPMTCWCG